MKKTFYSQPRKGFTLIELIVVIGILATLAGISYPVIIGMQESAKATNAKQVCAQIVDGVDKFYNDCWCLPVNADAPYDSKDQIFLNTKAGEDYDFVRILTNQEDENDDNRLNKRSTIYLRADEQEDANSGLIVNSNGDVSYLDPWGSPYHVVLCIEERGCVDPFKPTKRYQGRKCLVYSTGPDKAGVGITSTDKAAGKTASASEEDKEDNIYSWKKSK